MVESQRSGLRSLLQAGTFPALPSILTPCQSVELAPSKLLPPGGLEDQGVGPGVWKLSALHHCPTGSVHYDQVTPGVGAELALTHTLPGPHFQSCRSTCLHPSSHPSLCSLRSAVNDQWFCLLLHSTGPLSPVQTRACTDRICLRSFLVPHTHPV